ncbi:Alpha/Beta hydrolase protein [Fennellomyces sp. T-0311]|nr:Alpha/Beta hydrolase protein [Fennellomyces sp. T-0311]
MTTFQSERNPSASVRYLQPTLCDPNVTQYSGYFDISPSIHYFFWFFESRNGPANSPVTLWLNGGPACSSMVGLWVSHGPCRVYDNGTFMDAVYNPYSWNRYSNLLFLDQPVGSGFSYGDMTVGRAVDGSQFVYESLQLFFEAFPQYSQNSFHMFGESYAGRYIPEYARYIVDRNAVVEAGANLTVDVYIQIESIGLGNPWIDPLYHYQSDPHMACDSTYPFTLPAEACTQMANDVTECIPLVNQCAATNTDVDCFAADDFCRRIEEIYLISSNQSFTDVRVPAIQITPPATYTRFLNLLSTRSLIGAAVPYTQCSETAVELFFATGDMQAQDQARTSGPSIRLLLDTTDINFLIYVGDADFLGNWYGNNALFNALPWMDAGAYMEQPLVPWTMNGREVGQIKSFGPLTFIRIYDAGHVVPYYQPLPSLAMFHAWITGASLNSLPPVYANEQ